MNGPGELLGDPTTPPPLSDARLGDDLLLSVVTGSRAYGLDSSGSDTDRRGVFAAPTEDFWRLDKPPTHRDGPLPEQFSWEVERFCALCLAANPTVLECLWSPLVEVVTPYGERLLELRGAFLSQRAHETFAGYADAQFRRLDPAAPNWKQAMHMIRLLLSGLHLIRHGEPLVRMDAFRDRLLSVRRGEAPWAEVDAWRAALNAELTAELDAGRGVLPAVPDRERVEEFLMDVRRGHL
ncbi:nucleotidyltransferase domain-containing protein [Nonomuraea sp. 3-1Str]|uniref:nucleotidyltransferase domain-containing protein n=1 Tax=Nonomuraea sp. 3-1Str TaxID=2929801 RepID=UPI0028607CD4|nr:nucleotidyltransferase domain-containing protein [Nonomuraea sp. 3-1Str]MDR8410841.1 nucleotidyltransferase domain-containing protein [Nonomuraea sp. 3-1Str]